MIFFVAFIVLFVAIVAFSIVAKRKREKAMANASLQQGWAPLVNDAATLYQYLPQYLAMLGLNGYGFVSGFRRVTQSYDMAYQAKSAHGQVIFFQYQYTEYYTEFDPNTNQEQERSETHHYIVVRLDLPTNLPTMLLLHHSFLSKLADFGQHSGLQQISLEGDFNKSFDTFIAPNSQVEALSLLTPDTMQIIMNTAKGASAQISGQSLILSFEGKYLTPEIIEPVLAGLDQLATNISNKAQSRLQALNNTAGSNPV